MANGICYQLTLNNPPRRNPPWLNTPPSAVAEYSSQEEKATPLPPTLKLRRTNKRGMNGPLVREIIPLQRRGGA